MRTRHIVGISMFAAALLGSSAAFATPVTSIDGVTIPTGISIPGGIYLSSEPSYESLITASGQTLRGVVKVGLIGSNADGTTTYTYGQGGAYLHGYFDGFIADQVVAPTATTAGFITFTGGTLKYYVSGSDTFTTLTGSQVTDIANASIGALWLDLKPATIDAAGHTLKITIPANDTGLGVFSGANTNAYLDVIGGDAAWSFNTNTFVNPFSITGNNDINFQGTANSGSASDFPVSGTNALKANAVPEPITLSLFGAGLAGAAAFRRKSKKSKA